MLISLLVLILIIHIFFTRHVYEEGTRYYEGRVQNGKIVPRVYDISMKHLPDLSECGILRHISNFIAFGLPFLFSWEVSKEFVSYFIVIMILRHFVNSLTILPKIKKKRDDLGGIYHYLVGHGFDLNFSGHFSSGLLLSYILYNHKIITSIPLLILFNILNGLIIVLLRSHYTIDIITAFFVVTVIFQNRVRISFSPVF